MSFTSAASFYDPLSWPIYPEIGPTDISPHGLGIALGFLAGAMLMARRARRSGGPPEVDVWNALFLSLVGGIIGTRVGYVIGHFPQVTDGGNDIMGIFRMGEGGISVIGAMTGGVLFSFPYIRKKKMGFWRTMDHAAVGWALGLVIGRVGDLLVGDHIGEPTTFALGWRCTGSGGEPPIDADVYLQAFAEGQHPSAGCYDLVLHQTALYDLFSAALLFGVLLWVGRKARTQGLLALIFTVWYASTRLLTDFLRVDERFFGLTGSQLMSAAVGVVCVYLLVRYRGAPAMWQVPPAEEEIGAIPS